MSLYMVKKNLSEVVMEEGCVHRRVIIEEESKKIEEEKKTAKVPRVRSTQRRPIKEKLLKNTTSVTAGYGAQKRVVRVEDKKAGEEQKTARIPKEFVKHDDAQRRLIAKGRDGKVRKEQHNDQVKVLNNDLLFEIFTKVPANILTNRCMCQCKEWSNMISDQTFIKAYFRQSKEGIIFMEQVKGREIYLMKFMEYKDPKVIQVHKLHKFKIPLMIRSSCNGLVLVEEGYDAPYHVMNPMTKKCITFSPCEHDWSLWRELVYAPSMKEYKVVELFYDHNCSTGNKSIVLHIQTLAGCLRHITVPKDYAEDLVHDGSSSTISLDGVLYWNLNTHQITAFDVCSETYRLIQWPVVDESIGSDALDMKVMKIGGFLSLVTAPTYDENCQINVWILKDTTSKEWVRLFCIDRKDVIDKERYHPYDIVGSLSNGELIVFNMYGCGEELCVYDVKTKQWRLMKYSDTKKAGVFYHHQIHINSLF